MDFGEARASIVHDSRVRPADLVRAIDLAGDEKAHFHASLSRPIGWKSPAQPEAIDTSGADFAVLGSPGEAVEVEAHLAPGKVTVVDFWAVWCQPCHALAKQLLALARAEPRLAIRQLDIVDWDSPATKRWLKNIPTLPYLRIYGPDRKLAAALSGDETTQVEHIIDRLLGK